MTEKRKQLFTLTELIMILVIIAVLTASVVTTTSSGSSDAEKIATEQMVKAQLRYVRSLALNYDDRTFTVSFSATSASISATTLSAPIVTSTDYIFPTNSNSYPTAVTATTVTFDQWGEPTANTTVTVGDKTITILPTGYIQ